MVTKGEERRGEARRGGVDRRRTLLLEPTRTWVGIGGDYDHGRAGGARWRGAATWRSLVVLKNEIGIEFSRVSCVPCPRGEGQRGMGTGRRIMSEGARNRVE